MPRDVTGNYTLPEAPFTALTPILAARVNSNLSDIAAALTASRRVTDGAFTGAVTATSATVAGPVTGAAGTFTSLNGGPLGGFRNLVINGNPIINQRDYASGAAVAGANTYTLDRWRVVVSGQAASWTDSAGVRTVTAPAGGMEQVVEGASVAAGVYTMSWQGAATGSINGAAVANGGQATLVGGANQTIRMAGGTWALLQLDRSTVATPFEWRPIGGEIALCQRYLWRGYHVVASPVAGSTTATINTPAPMRATPSVSAALLSQANITSYSAVAPNETAIQVDATFTSTGYSSRTITADAEF